MANIRAKFEVHGTRKGKPFYSTFEVHGSEVFDPTDQPLIIKIGNAEKRVWDFWQIDDAAIKIYESLGVADVVITDSRF